MTARLVTVHGDVRASSDRLSAGGLLRSVGVIAAALVVAGVLLRAVFRGPRAGPAIALSAAIAVVVQLLSFVAARAVPPRRVLAIWLGSSVIRLLTLVGYGLLGVRLLALPAAPALLSLATFFFVTTLAEARLHFR